MHLIALNSQSLLLYRSQDSCSVIHMYAHLFITTSSYIHACLLTQILSNIFTGICEIKYKIPSQAQHLKYNSFITRQEHRFIYRSVY